MKESINQSISQDKPFNYLFLPRSIIIKFVPIRYFTIIIDYFHSIYYYLNLTWDNRV